MKRLFFLSLCLLMIVSCSDGSGQLRCNYNSTDISTTDDEHVILAGFAARKELSTGIHLPLRSHCLVITDGDEKVCIISSDLMEISMELADEMRDSISARSGLAREKILMHCIHSHSAPRMGGASTKPGSSNYTYKNRTVASIVDNAVRTICEEEAFKPFTLETAECQTGINTNRCEEGGPRDGTVYAFRVKDADGKPVCAAINIACHPVCMGYKSLLLSSDYSGVARKAIEEEWGCEVFQLTGAAGNMDPKGGCQMADHAEEIGAELAADLKGMEFKPVKGKAILKFATGQAELPYMIDAVTPEAVKSHADSLVLASTDFPRFADDVRRWEADILERFEEGGVENTLHFSMAALNIDGITFFFTQGEPFCEFQMKARETSRSNMIFFAGYTNGQNAYLPSAHAFEYRKGYEYELEQMHVYIGSPYPLSSRMPAIFQEAVDNTIKEVL